MEHIINPFKPIYDQYSRILILGTIPSPKSRAKDFYYSHPQNRFWKVLAAVLCCSEPNTNQQKYAFLLKHHIALWDVLQECDIQGANDSSIRNPVSNQFTQIFSCASIRHVYTTGRTATQLYQKLTGRPCIYLPSPSPANCALSWEDLVNAYAILQKDLLE